MFAGLNVMFIELWIKNIYIKVLFVSIDYHKYFEVDRIHHFFSSSQFYIFLVLHYIFKTSAID
jgi:hypothetical protein